MNSKKKKFILRIGIIAIIALAIFFALQLKPKNIIKLKKRNPENILNTGRLAALTASTTDVKAEGWSSLFSGVDYLMFKSTPEDIKKFIKESKSIDTLPEVFDENHQYLQLLEPNDLSRLMASDPNKYYQNKYFLRMGNSWPEWYNPTINKKGRIYKIPAENNHNWGEVIINDETNTVYIWVCWS